jgi:adenylate cyclase
MNTPNQRHNSPKRKLIAIMFTDIVGYTALMGEDEYKASEMIRQNRKIQLSLIHHHKGACLKEMGDGILASFSSAINAVRCAMNIQQFAQKENIPLRIGIHQGDVLFENNEVLGDGVNIASRIEQATEPGSISISETVFNEVKNKPNIYTEFLDEMTFKNVKEPVKVHKVLYDLNTELDYALIKDPIPVKRNLKVLFSFLALLMVVILAVVLLPKMINNPGRDMERSIAVLPFDNESADERNAYFVNGMMEDIRNNLAKIGDLRVISKTSTEKYRASLLTVNEIAKELNVNYVLEGTVQKSGNQVKIHAQLIKANTDDHIWVDSYTRDLNHVFIVQSEIAGAIADALYAVITPTEQEIIEKIPTSNITAYDIYLQARDQYNKYLSDLTEIAALEEAIILYRRALDYDSTFARAYTGLALAYWNKNYWTNYFDNTFLDSVMSLTNIALSLDDKLDEGYLIRGMCYSHQIDGNIKALNDYRTALEINPNFAEVYHEMSNIYAWIYNDFVEAIKYRHLAVKLDQSSFLPVYLRRLGHLYSSTGFSEKARGYYADALLLDNDSVSYYNSITYQLLTEEKIKEGFENALKCYTLDSSRIDVVVPIIFFSNILGNDELANKHALKLVELFKRYNMFTPNDWHRIGYAFWKMGKEEEANYYFDEQIKWCLESIRLNKWYGRLYTAHYDIACIYVLRGEIDKAYQYLYEINKRDFLPGWWIAQFKYDPFFVSIRDDDRFIKLLDELEAKHQKEHDRVKAWLEQEGMI